MHLTSRRYLAFAGLLTTVVFAHATPVSDPANPEAPVPALPYQSAFQHYQAAPAASMSPDQAWRAAIAAVASEPDHGAMAGMNMHGAMPMPMQQADAEPGAKPMPKDMKMPMQMPMPMPMPSQEAAPPMNMHHDHGGAK